MQPSSAAAEKVHLAILDVDVWVRPLTLGEQASAEGFSATVAATQGGDAGTPLGRIVVAAILFALVDEEGRGLLRDSNEVITLFNRLAAPDAVRLVDAMTRVVFPGWRPCG